MSYSEFELIRRCFVDEGLGFDRDGVVLGIGDDAAIVQPPNGMAIALSLDTLVEGVHFLKHAPARLLARRALAAPLSKAFISSKTHLLDYSLDARSRLT